MTLEDRVAYFLTTSRLGFRRWRETDVDLAIALWGDPLVTALIDARGALSELDVRARLTNEIVTERETGVQYWPVFFLDRDELAGCCGLRPYGGSRDTLELGVHIRSAFWRRGLAYEAARAVIGYAFATLDVATLLAGHHPDNESSRALLGRLRFRHVRDELYPPTGLMHPSYELRRDEWSDISSDA